jgi:hypothetical protein
VNLLLKNGWWGQREEDATDYIQEIKDKKSKQQKGYLGFCRGPTKCCIHIWDDVECSASTKNCEAATLQYILYVSWESVRVRLGFGYEVCFHKLCKADCAAEKRRYDGHLVLPEYGLLLDSSLNGDMDMHAFGNGDPQMKGVWHTLVLQGVAIEAHEQNLIPDGTACSPGASKMIDVTIPGLGERRQTNCKFLLDIGSFISTC